MVTYLDAWLNMVLISPKVWYLYNNLHQSINYKLKFNILLRNDSDERDPANARAIARSQRRFAQRYECGFVGGEETVQGTMRTFRWRCRWRSLRTCVPPLVGTGVVPAEDTPSTTIVTVIMVGCIRTLRWRRTRTGRKKLMAQAAAVAEIVTD